MSPHTGCTPSTCFPHYESTPTIAAGQGVYVDVSYSGGNAAYYLENITLGTFHTYFQTTSYFSNSLAEAVVEDADFTSQNGWVPGHYNAVKVQEEDAVDGAGFWEKFGSNLTDDTLDLGEPGTTFVYDYPGAINGSNGAFTICPTC